MTNEQINKQLAKAQTKADKEQARDLMLCITNYEITYMFIRNAIHNLQQKIKKNTFDETQAIQMFYNVVVESLKNPRFNRLYTYDIKMVDVPTRYYTAVELAEHFEDEIFAIE